VARFTEALDDPDGGRKAAQALRSLIGEIVLTPGKKRGEVHAELRGERMGILEFVNAEGNQRSSCFMPPVAACPRNHFQLTRRPGLTGRPWRALAEWRPRLCSGLDESESRLSQPGMRAVEKVGRNRPLRTSPLRSIQEFCTSALRPKVEEF